MSKLKKKFRDGLGEFYENRYKIPENKLNDLKKSEGLGLFYFTEIFNKKNPGVFPEDPDEYDQIITDGKDDQGIDMVLNTDNHHYIIQLKYRGKRKAENENDIINFRDVFIRIHDEVGSSYKKNDKLMDAIGEIDFKNDTFHLLFITLGSKTKDIKNYENIGINNSDFHNDLKDLSERTELQVLDEEQLNMEYRDVLNNKDLKKVKLILSPSEEGYSWYKTKNDEGKISYISTINSSQIYQIYTQYREALFNLNIRNFIGDTSTNKGVQKSALEDSKNFFFYNNGLSAIAAKVEEDNENNTLICHNFSIINGAQTFRSISKVYNRGNILNTDIKELEVMIRITITPDFYKNTEFIDNITQFNNTQNVIKISDFRSNDGVQKSIHDYFNKVSYSGKKYYYKNKRSKEHPRNSIRINLDDFCKVIHSYLKGPVDCFGGLKYLYETNNQGGYFYLFGDQEENKIIDSINAEGFKKYSSIWFLFEASRDIFDKIRKRRIKLELDSDPENSQTVAKRALQGKFMFMYVLGTIIRHIVHEKGIKEIQFFNQYNIDEPNTFRNNEKFMSILESVLSIVADLLIQDFQNKMNNKDFVYRNWFRSKETLTSIKQSLISKISELDRIVKEI